MEAYYRELLESRGVNVDQTLGMMMNNEDFYFKMLGKFPVDPNFGKLCESMEAKDYEMAFKASHTMKGLAGNLGFGKLTALAVELTEVLRNPPYDEQKACDLYVDMKTEYEEVISALLKMGIS